MSLQAAATFEAQGVRAPLEENTSHVTMPTSQTLGQQHNLISAPPAQSHAAPALQQTSMAPSFPMHQDTQQQSHNVTVSQEVTSRSKPSQYSREDYSQNQEASPGMLAFQTFQNNPSILHTSVQSDPIPTPAVSSLGPISGPLSQQNVTSASASSQVLPMTGLGDEYEEAREQDRYLPIANIARIMKNTLPENAKIAKDSKEAVQECVSEFISFITSEASDKCMQEKRKTINGDDLLWAMSTLGFDKYVEPLKLYLSKYREAVKGEKPDKRSRREMDS